MDSSRSPRANSVSKLRMTTSQTSRRSRDDRKASVAADEDEEDSDTWAKVRNQRPPTNVGHNGIVDECDTFSEYAETVLDVPPNRNAVSRASVASLARGYQGQQHKFYKSLCRKLKIIPRTHFLRQLGQSHISMHNESIDPKELNAICSTLLTDRTVRGFDIGGTVITAKMLGYLNQLLQRNTRITDLVLSEGCLTNSVLYLVVELLNKFKFIRKLDLSGNKFDDNDGTLLGNVILEGTALQYLNLSHNNIRERGAILIGNAIASTSSITHLDISWNHLRGKGAECIALGLLDNTSIKVLNVSWNGFGFEGCVAMGHVLRSNTTLTELNLICNRVHPPALLQLLKGLNVNRSLLVLRLGKNPIPASFTSSILCVIRDSPEMALQHFDMSGVIVNKEFEVVLEEVMEARNFRCTYEHSLPVHKTDAELNFTGFSDKTVFNVDPVRILFFLKKNLRALDLFNRIDTDGSSTISRDEIGSMLRREGLPVSSSAMDKIMEYLDTDGNGEVDLREFMEGSRRFKRDILSQKALFEERERMKVEKGDAKGDLNADVGGLGGRFSKTFRKNPEKYKEELENPFRKARNKSGRNTAELSTIDDSLSPDIDRDSMPNLQLHLPDVHLSRAGTGASSPLPDEPGLLSAQDRRSNKLFLTTNGQNTPVSPLSSAGTTGSSKPAPSSTSGDAPAIVDVNVLLPPIGSGQMVSLTRASAKSRQQ